VIEGHDVYFIATNLVGSDCSVPGISALFVRLSLFVAKRHRAPTRYGRKLVAYESPNRTPDQPQRTRHRPTTQPAVAG
jgi:hypothetical protein